jgi:hypothetical protein
MGRSISSRWRSRSRYEQALILLFLLSLPFVHARIRGDGIGYYGYLRSPLIDHNLRFASDWNDPPDELLRACGACPESAKQYWNHPAHALLFVYLDGHIYENPVSRTGYLPNFYTLGPALLWAPFVIVAHLAVLAANHLGFWIEPDGHSWPYIAAVCSATALYGFVGLYLSFQLARSFVEEIWAFWATVGIWFASSLPVYMYLDPSWSHAHSAFCASLFLWYWNRTAKNRAPAQWLLLGAISGLMLDVFPGNVVFLLALVLEWLSPKNGTSKKVMFAPINLKGWAAYAGGAFLAFLPTLAARQIVFGNPFSVGAYESVRWHWENPAFRAVLFSANRGAFVWTPILLLAAIGLFALLRVAPGMAKVCMAIVVSFYLLISFYPWWHGAYSFGNRFFVSLTPIFVLGLAAAFSSVARLWPGTAIAGRRIVPVTALFILWNLGLMYQWSAGLLPDRGPVYWDEVIYDQFREVPQAIAHDLAAKLHKPAAINR